MKPMYIDYCEHDHTLLILAESSIKNHENAY